VDIESQSVQSTEESYDPAKTVQKESSTETETLEETSPSGNPSGEPGAMSNVGIVAGSGGSAVMGAGGPSSTSEKTITKFETKFGRKETHTTSAPGKPRVVSASVRVPLSWFVTVAKKGNASASEPDEARLAQVIQVESDAIRKDVRNLTGISDEQAISVEPYTVAPTMMAVALAGGTPKTSSGFNALLAGHYKEIALGVLALVSLYMVNSMVKKSSPAPVIAPPMELKEAPMLAGGEEIAGDVSEGNAALDGMELDEDAVQSQQMVEQVSTMVKENPDAAANLIKRWLNRT
jgi:flagellar biosynthesis/type III secretory pathway M-ring protein FliF/YscJ